MSVWQRARSDSGKGAEDSGGVFVTEVAEDFNAVDAVDQNGSTCARGGWCRQSRTIELIDRDIGSGCRPLRARARHHGDLAPAAAEDDHGSDLIVIAVGERDPGAHHGAGGERTKAHQVSLHYLVNAFAAGLRGIATVPARPTVAVTLVAHRFADLTLQHDTSVRHDDPSGVDSLHSPLLDICRMLCRTLRYVKRQVSVDSDRRRAGMAELPKHGLGVVLRVSREARGMSRRDLAEASGLSYPYVSELETGAKYPSDRALHNLASALDMDYLELEARARSSESEAAVGAAVDSLQAVSIAAADRDLEDVIVKQVIDQLQPIIRAAVRAALES